MSADTFRFLDFGELICAGRELPIVAAPPRLCGLQFGPGPGPHALPDCRPFSLGLGLIHGQTLLLNLVLSPVIVAGVFGGRWIINRIPQRLFDEFLLAFAALAALRLIGLF